MGITQKNLDKGVQGIVPIPNLPIATQEEAELSTSSEKIMTPERVMQSLVYNVGNLYSYGFVNRTDSSISFNNTTREFTITGTDFEVYCGANGKKIKNTESIQIGTTTGLYYVYYNSNATLANSMVFPGFNSALIGTVYWNNVLSKGIVGEERHGIVMDYLTHSYLHNTVGTRYQDGLSGTFTDSTFSIGNGTIWDEDIKLGITTQTACDVFYKDGDSSFKWLENQTKYFYDVSGLYFNDGNTLTAVGSNNYVAYWIFATSHIDRPIISIMGQRQDGNITNARLNNTYESLSLSDIPFPEYKVLYRVILRNTSTPSYIETQDLRSISNIPSGTFVATDHNTLTNIGVNSHSDIDTFISGGVVDGGTY